jgi:hypothetical protein
MYVNLLPKSFVWRRAIQRRLRQWGIFYGILLAALACWNIPLVQEWIGKRGQLQEIQTATNHILDLQVDRMDLAKEVVVLQQNIGQLSRATTNDKTTSILGILARGVYATDNQVQIQEMQLAVSPKSEEPANPSSGSGVNQRSSKLISTNNAKRGSDAVPPSEYRLTLRGIATKSDAITTLVNSLQESKAFPTVELRSTHEQIISEQPVQEFQLECLGDE